MIDPKIFHPQSPALHSAPAPRRELTLFDSTCIIVGIIVAAGIYRSSPEVARLAPSPAGLFGLWALGGVLSLIGAMCYAELATAYPLAGGDYVYLTRAFGRSVGFLFAWCQLWIVRPGSIGAMAYAFAEYANRVWPQAAGDRLAGVLAAYAAGAIVVLTAVNVWGVREGKWTQNTLTAAKILGLGGLVLAGLLCAAPARPAANVAAAADFSWADVGLAMIFVLFTYGGWNEMAYVGAEVKNPRKNILRAMLIGTLAVTVVYLLVNAAFWRALGFEGMRRPVAAADVLELAIGPRAGAAISLLICISALGAINGQILTGARIYYAMGVDHRLYAWLGRWSARRGTPVCSLLVQGAITLALAVVFGLSGNEGFDSMVKFTTPGFWFFLTLVGLAVFVLRRREPGVERPFRVPGYPVTPAIFCLSSAFMVYASLAHAVQHQSWEAFWSIGVLLVGAALCLWENRRAAR